ncbi:MAG: Ig-like domain-containing protein [Acidimicrobiales bacterium]
MGFEVSASAAVTGVTFAPTTTAAGVATSWDIGFTASAALTATSTITVSFAGVSIPASTTFTTVSGFATNPCTAPTVAVNSPSAGEITITTGTGCTLAASTPAVFALSGFTNPSAGTLPDTDFSVSTDAAGNTGAVNPAAGVTFVTPFPTLNVANFPGTLTNPAIGRDILTETSTTYCGGNSEKPQGVATNGTVVWVAFPVLSSICGYAVSTGLLEYAITSGGIYTYNASGSVVSTTTGASNLGGGSNVNWVAVDGNGSSGHLWASVYQSAAVDEFTLGANDTPTFTRSITVGSQPYGLSDDGTDVWVPNPGASGGTGGGTLSEINVATGVATTVSAATLQNIAGPFMVSTDGTHVWVAMDGTGGDSDCLYNGTKVVELNASNASYVRTITVPQGLCGISSDGTDVWVSSAPGYNGTNDPTGSVTEINCATGTIVGSSITVGGVPDQLVSDGTDVWVTNRGSGTVSEIGISTHSVINTFTLTNPNKAGTSAPRNIADDGSHVWVTSFALNETLFEIYNKPVITTTTVANGQATVAYNQAIAITGGQSPFVWSLASGSLPPGLSLNTSSGAITGTPTTVGSYTFTLAAADAGGILTATSPTYSIVVSAGPVSAANSSIVVTNANNPPNGTSCATATVTLEDADHNVIPNVAVSLTGLSGTNTVYTNCAGQTGANSENTNASGVATLYVTDTASESVTLSANAQSTAITGSSTTATFALLSQNGLNESASPSSPVAGQSVQMSASGGNDGGMVTYALASGAPSNCVLNATTGVLTSHDKAITCPVIATMAGNGTYAPVSSSTLNVTFVPGPVSAAQSSVVVTNPNQPANGTSYATVTVTLDDQYGNPVSNQSVALTNIGSSMVYTGTGPLSGSNSATTNSSGVATFYVADATAETVTYGATDSTQSTVISGSPSSAATFGFLAQGPLSESANPSSPTAGQSVQMSASGGSDGGAITFALASGAPSSCMVTSSGVLTSSNAAVTCPVVATMAGNGTYAPVNSSTVNVTFSPGPVNAANSSIVVSDATEPADGSSYAIVTVTLEDQYGNVIPGQTVTLGGIGSSSVHTGVGPLSGVNSLNSDSYGTATFYVTDSTIENVTYTASAQSTTISGPSATTTADFGQLAQSPLNLSLAPPETSNSPVAGSSPQIDVTGGNGSGAVSYQLAGGAPSSCMVSSSGVVTSTLAVTCPVNVTKAGSGAYGPTTSGLNVTFVAGPVSLTTSTVVANPASVTNPGTTSVTVTLEDQYGNPVDNQSVVLAATGSALVAVSPASTGSSNIAYFTVSDTAAETVTLSATDASQSNYAIGSTPAMFAAASSGGGGGGGGGGGATLLVVTSSLPGGIVGQPYGTTLTASGATGPASWTCSGLPSGLACSSAGILTGTPLVSGAFSVTVTVSNNGQTDSQTIPLTVTNPSTSTGSAPSDVTAVAGDSDALVTFVPPADVSQLVGIKYTITANPGGATCVTTSTSCLVTGLTNGTTYTFSVVVTSSSPPATSPPGVSNPVTPSAAPILEGPNGVGTTTLTSPIKPLSPGSVTGTYLNGSSSAGSLGVSNSSVTARGDGVTMTITTSSTISTTTGFTVVLVKDGAAKVTGTGFLPGSVVDLYIFSPQFFLGSVVVNANGTYSARIRIPTNVPVGTDTVLSQGFVKSGARASVSVGIVVDAANAALLTLFPFATGFATLTPTMDRQLQGFALEVKKFGTGLIVLTGYTDTVGGLAYNLALGGRRAQSAATYLQQALLLDGVAAEIRFETKSKGSTAPSASNLTVAGRARNRNVTVFATLY